jgi:hypothetical protein
MHLPYHSLSRQSNSYSYLTRIHLTISSFDELLRGLPKLCHRLDKRGVRRYSGLFESPSNCHNFFRNYGMTSLVKLLCSVTPTRLPRALHNRSPLYHQAKSMSSKWKSYTGYIPWGIPLCAMLCPFSGSQIHGYSILGSILSEVHIKRPKPGRKSYYLCPLNQLFTNHCP